MEESRPTDLHRLDARFADIANSMKDAQKRISQDPKVKELILKRIALPRSHDGRQRFQLTTEIRELIKADTQNKRRAAVKEAFARHTCWGKIASELRINRPQSADPNQPRYSASTGEAPRQMKRQ